MLRAAARALRRRPEAARVAAFLRAAALPDGSFRDRAGQGDLYYTVFGLQALIALRGDHGAERGDQGAERGGQGAERGGQGTERGGSPDPPRGDAPCRGAPARGGSGEPPRNSPTGEPAAIRSEPAAEAAGDLIARAEPYLRSFGAGASLDFVHTACLARCWALVAKRGPDAETRRAVLARLETWRSADGGYNPAPGAAAGTAYASFLALGACEDFAARVPDETGLARSLAGLRSADGGYANTPAAARGSTAATAAAIVTLMELGRGVDSRTTDWLLAQHGPEGGFRAIPAAPIPDLLSTATALHALARAGVSLDEIRQPCREFVEGLWADDGGFRGHWADDATDCEYTFYGLLALGRLAE
jgi:prenyltransferase beta subunit